MSGWRWAALLVALGLLLAPLGCAAPAPQARALTPAAAAAPTAIPATTLDAAYLAQGGADVAVAIAQGAARINNVASSCTPDEFGFGYVSQSWRRQIALQDLAADPLAMVQFLVALGAFRENTGVLRPGWQEQTLVFASLDGLALPRLRLAQPPPAADLADATVAPRGLAIHPGAELTVLGLLPADQAPPRALVALSDPTRAGWLATRHYLAVLPVAGPGLTLAGLLTLGGATYDAAQGVAGLTVDGLATPVQLNAIADAKLAATLEQAAGLAYVDALPDGRPVEPLIPYPDLPLPASWALELAADGALALHDEGAQAAVAVARYDAANLVWKWEAARP